MKLNEEFNHLMTEHNELREVHDSLSTRESNSQL
jgi:hypothetical protein